ncbi:MAG: hypothetical protein KDN22_14570 [Verrucomicrobiae bacterium]|nr:hypothetical protein [Verrucomicrobiae bacterium]
MNMKNWAFWRVVLCGFIAVFVQLSLPYSPSVQDTGKRRQTESAAQGLRNSIKQFSLEYHTFGPFAQGAEQSGDLWLSSDSDLMAILLGQNNAANPRKIAFGEWRDAGQRQTNGIIYSNSGTVGPLVDSWGMPFHIQMDGDGNGQVVDPSDPQRQLEKSIIVYSAGPDRNFATWPDNVTTWK